MKLVVTSVVRGAQQGDSHGGVYLIDLQDQTVEQKLDWNTVDIDWQGRGWDRGRWLRSTTHRNARRCTRIYVAGVRNRH